MRMTNFDSRQTFAQPKIEAFRTMQSGHSHIHEKIAAVTRHGERTDWSDSQRTIVLVCDFPFSQVPRILDVYRFFQNPPRIILVRKGGRLPADLRILVESEVIPLPVKGAKRRSIVHALSAACSAAGYLLCSFITYLRICRRRNSILLVHAHYIFPQGLFGLILSRFLRVPLVISAVGQDVNEDMKDNSVLRALCHLILERALITIAVSRPLQRDLQGFGIRNTIYVPNSVDTKRFHPTATPSSGDSVLFVGTLIPRKRPLLLLRAFESVAETIPKATLTMIGTGPLGDIVREDIELRGLGSRVKLIPYVPLCLLQDMLSQATVFVLPSAHEGLSLALLEAMAAGKVIVASANKSHCEILRNGSNALLFQLDNEKDLAKQIISALTDEQLRLKLSQSARRLCAEEFSNEKIGSIVEEIYSAASGKNSLHSAMTQ
jgi:glycosyltransferase involved in cell wall biosynthesis